MKGLILGTPLACPSTPLLLSYATITCTEPAGKAVTMLPME